jgi:hypothetical protein
MTEIQITHNIREIERCNQRGGRMLSVIDLIDRNTIDLRLAAYLAAKVYAGASFIVGAVPGGGGKTTVMGAFLNLLPPTMKIIPVDSHRAIRSIEQHRAPVCALAHEISTGMYYAYIWADMLRSFFAFPRHGHTIATNLHADDLDQAYKQICVDNGVSEEQLNSVDLFLFLRKGGGLGSPKISVHEVLRFDRERKDYRPVSADGHFDVESGRIDMWERFLASLLKKNVYTIEAVRKALVSS